MLKLKTVLVIAFLVFSTSSLAHANEPTLAATDNSNRTIPLEKEVKKYTVAEGDNLYRIALKHNISLEALVSWNNIDSALIHPGDELVVKDNGTTVKSLDIDWDGKVATQSNFTMPPIEIPNEKIAIQPPSTNSESSNEIVVTATAYTAYCAGCSGTTAYGIDLRANPNQKVIAVDPRVIPLGTRVWVEGYGEAIAGDTGGAIKGNKIDVFIPTEDAAMAWGVKTVKLRVLN